MHARQLVELSGWVAAHGKEILETPEALLNLALQEYWVASKCRLERWKRMLHKFQSRHAQPLKGSEASGSEAPGGERPCSGVSASGNLSKANPTPRFLATLEEILLSDVLTRIWTALMESYDHRHGAQQAGPIARSVFVDHLEVRSRVLHLLLHPEEELLPKSNQLNQLRSHTERWTDFLLGILAELVSTKELAFDPSRSQDFAMDFSYSLDASVRQQAWNLALRSLQRAFAVGLQPIPANPEINETIAHAVLQCLPREIHGDDLLDNWFWPIRLSYCTSDLQAMIESLLAETISKSSPPLS